jgi:hypothetical protein
MAVDVYPVDADTCVRQYEDITLVNHATMLCAGRSMPNFDSCGGDSGGPLLDKATGELVGIVSFGKGCGNPDFPGVYTRVSKYTSWIHDRICELSAVPPADCPAPNSNSKTGELKEVILDITYDNHPTESFWRLEDDATGQAVAFQPGIPERGASFSQVILLPPGKYTLHFLDIAGDGICCKWGDGKIVISAIVGGKGEAEAPVAVHARKKTRVEVLADSDGSFKYRLSLPFVVASDLHAYTISSGNKVNLVAILVGVAIAVTVLW